MPQDPHERDCFPGPGTPSLAQGEVVFFPVFYKINSHVALLGSTLVMPMRDSMCPLVSSRKVAILNASTTPEPDAQAHQTLKKHRTHHNTRCRLNSVSIEKLVCYNCRRDYRALSTLTEFAYIGSVAESFLILILRYIFSIQDLGIVAIFLQY